jgi:hypothetical protein
MKKYRYVGMMLALLVALAAWVGGVSAQDGQPPPPAPTEQDAERLLNPFPVPRTEAMTETVKALLADYSHMAMEQGVALVEPMAVPNSSVIIHIPMLMTEPRIPPPPPPPPRPHGADVAVTIWPNPSIIVARDGLLTYEVRVKNYGKGDAASTHVRLPYSTQQMVVTGSRFSNPNDWVSELTNDQLTITFGNVKHDEHRMATIYFKVHRRLPDNTVLNMRATYRWDDARDGGSWMSNWAPVLVGNGNQSSPWVWLEVTPVSGVSGTTFHFYTDRYIPSEGVYTWLNTPSGVRATDMCGVADPLGRIWFDVSSRNLTPGAYSLVLYGARSNLVAIAGFYVS